MYSISVMIFTFSIGDFGHPKFLKSQFGHPVMKFLAKSLEVTYAYCKKIFRHEKVKIYQKSFTSNEKPEQIKLLCKSWTLLHGLMGVSYTFEGQDNINHNMPTFFKVDLK